MITVIKQYPGKDGIIIVEEYNEDGKIQYHVRYKNHPVFNTWHKYKRDAIARAQFISAKY